jgi:hypothetical protein
MHTEAICPSAGLERDRRAVQLSRITRMAIALCHSPTLPLSRPTQSSPRSITMSSTPPSSPPRRGAARRKRARGAAPARLAIALAVVLALSVGIGVSSGAIPSGSGKIYGCFTKSGGAVRVIDKAKQQKCKSNEQTLNWNQQGPKGDPGPQGAKGEPGPKGSPAALKARAVSESATVPAGGSFRFDIRCAPGEVASGGGASANGEIARVLFEGAILAANGTTVGWSAGFGNPSSTPQLVEAQAICLST